jgi:hypothetical protein
MFGLPRLQAGARRLSIPKSVWPGMVKSRSARSPKSVFSQEIHDRLQNHWFCSQSLLHLPKRSIRGGSMISFHNGKQFILDFLVSCSMISLPNGNNSSLSVSPTRFRDISSLYNRLADTAAALSGPPNRPLLVVETILWSRRFRTCHPQTHLKPQCPRHSRSGTLQHPYDLLEQRAEAGTNTCAVSN